MKVLKSMKVLESRKFIIVAAVLNLIVMGILIGGIFHLKKSAYADLDSDLNTITSTTETKEEKVSSSDGNLSNIYMTLIENSYAELDDGICYRFGKDGEYSGFFDADNPKVKDYLYKIGMDGNDVVLTIYNKEETHMVNYKLLILDNGDIALDYPGFKDEIVLSY